MGSWAHDRLVELIEDYRRTGDADKFCALIYETLHRRYFREFYGDRQCDWIPDPQERADTVRNALEDAAIALVNEVDRGKEIDSPLGLCKTVARNRISDAVDHWKLRANVTQPLPAPPDAEGTPRDFTAELVDPRSQDEEHQRFEAVLQDLPEKCQRLFRLLRDRCSQKEIAAQLEITEQAVSQRKKKCLKLAKQLETL